MQSFTLLGLVRAWLLLRSVEEGRVARMKSYTFDREVIGWAWEPTWKGVCVAFGGEGFQSIMAILIAGFVDVRMAASFFLTQRLLNSLDYISLAILGSISPQLSRLLAQGQYENLKTLFGRRYASCIGTLFLSYLIFLYFGDSVLMLIQAKINLLPKEYLYFYCAGYLYLRCNGIFFSFSELGNNFILFYSRISVFLTSCIILKPLMVANGIMGCLVALFLPNLLIINIRSAAILSLKYKFSNRKILLMVLLGPSLLFLLLNITTILPVQF